MKKELRFVNIPQSKFIEDFVEKKVESCQHLFNHKQHGMKINLKAENFASTPGGYDYSCEVVLFEGKQCRSIVKHDSNIYRAASECLATLRRYLRNKHGGHEMTRKEKRERIHAKKRGLLVA